MKFKLSTAVRFYGYEDAEKLKQLGFKFKCYKDSYLEIIRRSNALGNSDGDVFIEINTLDELVDFVKKYGQIVFDIDSIEIYDDYRE